MDKDLTQRERSTDLGTVRINNDAITTIASVAALEVRGVYKMGGGLTRTLLERLTRRAGAKGVRIQVRESDVKLIVSIVVDYGVDIPHIADEVQDNVKRAVEKMTGLALSEVDVIVEGVRERDRASKEDRTGGRP